MIRKLKRIVKLPIYERFCNIKDDIIGGFETLVEVDGVGIYVKHRSKDDDISPEVIRKHLIGRRRNVAYVEAESIPAALEKFWSEWDGAKFGTTAKALWVASEGNWPIVFYPKCPAMYIHSTKKREHYCCGKPSKEYGSPGCILEQFDPPDECPLYDYTDSCEVAVMEYKGVEYHYLKEKEFYCITATERNTRIRRMITGKMSEDKARNWQPRRSDKQVYSYFNVAKFPYKSKTVR